MHLNWLAKFKLRGAGLLEVNIIVNYCCARKMLKEPETAETVRFLVTFFIIVGISVGGRVAGSLRLPLPLSFPGYSIALRRNRAIIMQDLIRHLFLLCHKILNCKIAFNNVGAIISTL